MQNALDVLKKRGFIYQLTNEEAIHKRLGEGPATFYTGFDPMNGNTIVIQHPGNIISIYKHNEVLLKSVGAKVNMGEAIAKMGSSGQNRMQSAHLHFELWYNGFPVNPLDYIVIK